MNAKLLREFIDWPTNQQEEFIRMQEEMDRMRAQNNTYRAQLSKHYGEMLIKIPLWRQWGIRFGAWLKTACTPKWFYGVGN